MDDKYLLFFLFLEVFVYYCLLGDSLQIWNFSLIWVRHNYRCRATDCPILITRGLCEWGFFSLQQLLWHGAFVYNAHSGPRDTRTYCRAFGSGTVTTCFFYDLGLSRLRFEHPTFRLRGERSNPLCHHCGPICLLKPAILNIFF